MLTASMEQQLSRIQEIKELSAKSNGMVRHIESFFDQIRDALEHNSITMQQAMKLANEHC